MKKRFTTAERQQVWLQYVGAIFSKKCSTPWCKNVMTVFDFHVGHNIPESKGGSHAMTNLRPVCKACNLSMGALHSIDSWNRRLEIGPETTKNRWCCF